MQQRKIPLRRCLGCNESKPKKELVRVVRSPAGEISLDLVGKKHTINHKVRKQTSTICGN